MSACVYVVFVIEISRNLNATRVKERAGGGCTGHEEPKKSAFIRGKKLFLFLHLFLFLVLKIVDDIKKMLLSCWHIF